jgi:hypothetical protein
LIKMRLDFTIHLPIRAGSEHAFVSPFSIFIS